MHAISQTLFEHVYVPAMRERFIHHNQKDVGLLGLSTSLKLEGVVLKHMVDVKLCVATVASSTPSKSALEMGSLMHSRSNEMSFKLERRESAARCSPVLGTVTSGSATKSPGGAGTAGTKNSRPGGGRRQGFGFGWALGSMRAPSPNRGFV